MKSSKKKIDHFEIDELVLREPAVAYNTSWRSNMYAVSDIDTLKIIKKGIPKKAFDKTMQMMDFSLNEMSDVLHVSERTLRRFNDESVLNVEQSERIVELNNLYRYGAEVLGSLSNFKLWIDSPILALGNKKPKFFLDTSLGISMLKNILGRIEHGVYS